MNITSIANLLPHIQIAGDMAQDMQRRGVLQRNLKADGSIVTQADTQIEAYLVEKLEALYPQANLCTEETAHEFDPQKPYTFALDPVDGTDVFSLGMPGWCVALALLDRALTPIASVIYAPRWEMLIFADVGARPTVNGSPVDTPSPQPISRESTIMVTSRVHRLLELSRYPGKIRSFGSAELHLVFPVIYTQMAGGIQLPHTYIWDIAAAHAVNRAVGYRFEYFSGQPIDYSRMVRGEMADDVIVSGSELSVKGLQEILSRRQGR